MKSSSTKGTLFDGNRVLSVKFNSECTSSHQMFFQPHKVKDPCPEKPLTRTLFISNIPPWATERSIQRLFSSNGPIDKVYFQRVPSSGPPPLETSHFFRDHSDLRPGMGFKYCYIVFERPSGVENAMKKMDCSTVKCLSTEENPIEVGLKKWRQEYNESIITTYDELKIEIEAFVAEHDKKKEAEVLKAEEEAEPDEEGWVTVSKHSSKKPVGKITTKAQAKIKAKEQRKRKRKELENFYKFQVKNSKLQKLDELKQKFEMDKKRQANMMQERKFRPNKM